MVQFGKTLALSAIGYLAFAALTRQLASPGTLLKDWQSDSLSLASSVLRLDSRANDGTLQDARDRVLGQFGPYIDPNSRCFDSHAEVGWDRLPPDAAGHYSTRDNAVYIAPIHLFGPTATGVHEYLHCFTHDGFTESTNDFHHAKALNEGVTQYLTLQVPIPLNQLYTSGYDRTPAGDGIKKTPVQLARAVVQALGQDGEEVLKKAYFSGEPAARKRLGDALYDVLPKSVTPNAWKMIHRIRGARPKMRPEKLVEMSLGTMLVHSPERAVRALVQAITALPAGQRERLEQWVRTDDAGTMLARLRMRTLEMREKFGADRFDSVFCRPTLDPKQRKTGMRELTKLWEPVLPKEYLRTPRQRQDCSEAFGLSRARSVGAWRCSTRRATVRVIELEALSCNPLLFPSCWHSSSRCRRGRQ